MKTLNLILSLALLLGCLSMDAQTTKKASTGAKSLSGHQYVDLGLPSGTLWATCNVGAESKMQPGLYFAWGETKQKSYSYYVLRGYKYYDEKVGFTKYAPNQEGFSDNKTELDSEDDAAYVNWGECWQTPSIEQVKELVNKKYTTAVWKRINNIPCEVVTSKINGVTLILPANGYASDGYGRVNASGGFYMSRSLNDVRNSCGFEFDGLNLYWTNEGGRYFGIGVRPVVSNVGMKKLGKPNVKFAQTTNTTSAQKEKVRTTDYVAPVAETIDANKVYDSVDESAKFPGGESAMKNWIKTHQVYPDECKQFGIQGNVRLSCVINQDGSISDIQSKSSANAILEKEAIRVVKGMPKWTPAKKSGTTVKSRVEIPFTFKSSNF